MSAIAPKPISYSGFNLLPDELIGRIFSFMDQPRGACIAKRTCRFFYQFSKTACLNFKLHDQNEEEIEIAQVQEIVFGVIDQLRKQDCRIYRITPKCASWTWSWKEGHIMRLDGLPLKELGLTTLPCELTAPVLKTLSAMPLKKLNLNFSKDEPWPEEALKVITELPLQEFEFHHLFERQFVRLEKMMSLKKLRVNCVDPIFSGKVVESLKKLTSLEHLIITINRATYPSIQSLLMLPVKKYWIHINMPNISEEEYSHLIQKCRIHGSSHRGREILGLTLLT